VFSCIILHNWIALLDGLDKRWEDGANWTSQDGKHGADILDAFDFDDDMRKPMTVGSGRGQRVVLPDDDFTAVGANVEDVEDQSEAEQHEALHKLLVTHMSILRAQNKLQWLH
jgi:hypothetical protein